MSKPIVSQTSTFSFFFFAISQHGPINQTYIYYASVIIAQIALRIVLL